MAIACRGALVRLRTQADRRALVRHRARGRARPGYRARARGGQRPRAHPAPPGYAEDTPLQFAGPDDGVAAAAQHAPDVVLPPALPGAACVMYDIEVFDPRTRRPAPHQHTLPRL